MASRARASLLAASAAALLLAGAAPAYATTPPTTVTGLAARAGDGQVALSWTNPADPDLAGVTVVEKDGATPPATVADGTTVYDGTGHAATATGLANGTAYAFSVFTRNTANEVSAPASVTATPVPAVVTTLSAAVSASTVTYAQTVVLSGTLRRPDGSGVAGAGIDVYRKAYGEPAFTLAWHIVTGSTGVARITTTPAKHTQWYLLHKADPYLGASTSSIVATAVRLRVTYALSATTVERFAPPVTLRGSVAPAHPGSSIITQVYAGNGRWTSIAWRPLDASSRITESLPTGALGTRRYRLYKPGDADHLTGWSASFTVTVVPRTLRSGMRGSDVVAVQQRLRALHYDVPAADGYFGFDTVHATAAFQKVNRLPVNGTVDAATRRRLASPVRPVLRHPRSGAWVEVDLTRQVLYYSRDGVVVRILDVSSGSGHLFTVGGVTQRAVTPTGSFRIFHTIDGLRISRLGSLWRPAYFASGGYAIHGNGSVPYYPASHGCIRITIPAMNRLFAMLTVGMPVYVYRS